MRGYDLQHPRTAVRHRGHGKYAAVKLQATANMQLSNCKPQTVEQGLSILRYLDVNIDWIEKLDHPLLPGAPVP